MIGERMMGALSRFAGFIERRKYIAGACFCLFLIFSECVPVVGAGAKIGDVPKVATVQFFLRPFPFLGDAPVLLLLIPSAICFLIAIDFREGF